MFPLYYYKNIYDLSTNLCVGRQLDSPFCGHGVTGIKHSACWDGTEHGQVLQGHLGGAIFSCGWSS